MHPLWSETAAGGSSRLKSDVVEGSLFRKVDVSIVWSRRGGAATRARTDGARDQSLLASSDSVGMRSKSGFRAHATR